MPYRVAKQGEQYCVMGTDGKPIAGGCHPTHADADQHMAALYAHVADARKAGARHSGADMADMQQIHDIAVKQGAMCGASKAVQIAADAHPGAMVALMLSPDQQQQIRDAAGIADAEADHVTLAYLAPDAADLLSAKNSILRGLVNVACCTPPLNGEIGGVARFAASESSDNQDVIVALYDSPDLPDLYAGVIECLEMCGVAPASDHGFTPHITLAYLAPDAPTPIETLPRLPLPIAALTIVWGGERIDLPLTGTAGMDADMGMGYGATTMDASKAVTNSDGLTASAFLVAEDPEDPSTWHLRVKDEHGKLDHRLMGAAAAALGPAGYRGNRYEGPQADAARAKLRALYKQEKMPYPGEGKADNTFVYAGDAVKALPNGHVGGYLVRFSTENDPDLSGEFFTKNTDFGVQSGAKTHVWFHHRGAFKTRDGRMIRVADPIGEGTLKIDDVGVFVDAVLYNREQYKQVLDELGWSSGTAGHLIDRESQGKATWIKRWPLGLDATLTFGPCEPRNAAVPLKSLPAVDVPLDFLRDTKSASEPEIAPETARSAVVDGKAVSALVLAYTTFNEDDIASRLDRALRRHIHA